VRTWRDPHIAVEVFNPQFEAPTFTTPEVEHHRSLASLKDCGNDQKCSLCKMVYSAIIHSAKEKRSRMRLPEDGTTFTFSGHFLDADKQHASDWSVSSMSLNQLPKGDLVFSTSPGDINAIQDDEVPLPLGGIKLSLTSGNAGAGDNPNLQIGVGQSHRSTLDIYPVNGMEMVHLIKVGYSDHV
jgi:hypothetical protein